MHALVHGVDPRAHVESVHTETGGAAFLVVLAEQPAPDSDEVALTSLSGGATFSFADPVRPG